MMMHIHLQYLFYLEVILCTTFGIVSRFIDRITLVLNSM